MLSERKNDFSQPGEDQDTSSPREDNVARVFCGNSGERLRAKNLYQMGLSLQAISAITGLTEKELRRLQ